MRIGILGALVITGMLWLPSYQIGPAHAQTKIAKQVIAKAEAAITKVTNACVADQKAYCSKVTPEEGRLVLCIIAHEDKISNGCFDAILVAAEGIQLAISNVRRAAEVCEADLGKLCANVAPGEGRIAQCLINNKSKLSTACRAEVVSFGSRFKK